MSTSTKLNLSLVVVIAVVAVLLPIKNDIEVRIVSGSPIVDKVINGLPDPGRPVRVVIDRMYDRWADTEWNDEAQSFTIRLDKSMLTSPFMNDVLAHEWAHILTWDAVTTDESDHGPLWGVSYAECYRTLFE